MIKNFIKGIQIGLGFIFTLGIMFGLVYAVGFHSADEIISGTFNGNYQFIGNGLYGFFLGDNSDINDWNSIVVQGPANGAAGLTIYPRTSANSSNFAYPNKAIRITHSATYGSIIGSSEGIRFSTNVSNNEGEVWDDFSINKVKMVISSNGNVGIGTTSPTTELDIQGDLKVSGKMYGVATDLNSDASKIYHEVVAEAWCINVAMAAGKADYTYGILWSDSGISCETTCTTNSWASAIGRLEKSTPQATTQRGLGWRQGGTTRINKAFCCCAN